MEDRPPKLPSITSDKKVLYLILVAIMTSAGFISWNGVRSLISSLLCHCFLSNHSLLSLQAARWGNQPACYRLISDTIGLLISAPVSLRQARLLPGWAAFTVTVINRQVGGSNIWWPQIVRKTSLVVHCFPLPYTKGKARSTHVLACVFQQKISQTYQCTSMKYERLIKVAARICGSC